jgi:Tfp pilus assembly protein PilO
MKFNSILHTTKLLFTKYFAVIMVLVIIVVLLSGYLLFIRQTVSEIQKIGVVDLKLKQDELATKQVTVKKLAALKERYQKLSSDELRQLDNFLPHQADIPYLIIEIKDFVQKNNLVLDDINAGPLGTLGTQTNTAPAVSGKALKTLTITLSISGIDSYSGLKNFLDGLAEQQPLLELTSLSYVPSSDHYTLNLTTYYQ